MLFVLSSASPVEALWQLRSGILPEPGVSVPGGAGYLSILRNSSASKDLMELRGEIAGGHTWVVFSVAARLVSSGDPFSAEIHWQNTGNPPADRGQLLSALAWAGRFQLYTLLAERHEVPEDMVGKMHQDQCAAVCAAGWMAPWSDGLFHPEQLVKTGDIILLSRYYPRFTGRTFISIKELDRLPETGE